MREKKVKAFTLIELMIVVAIIGILASIAIPNFLKFQAKAKQTEAKTNLGTIYMAQTAYFSVSNTYADNDANSVGCFQMMGWRPEGLNRYSYFCGNDPTVLLNKMPTGHCDGTAMTGPVLASSLDQSFTVGAVGNVDNDSGCDEWFINDAKILVNQINDL